MNKSMLIAIAGIVALGGLAGYSALRNYGETRSVTLPPPAAENIEQTESITNTNTSQTMPSPSEIKNGLHRIALKTNMGTVVFSTYDADAPKTTANFIKLAESGYYNGIIFHRVISGFMIQGGDPFCTNGNGPCGTGGPGYQFEDELKKNTESATAGYSRGAVAMANAGPNTNGSQFFIMHQDYPLPHNYTIFGKVIAGQDVVDKIAATRTDGSDRPQTPVIIESATVEINP